jgi:hypothetical protein
VESESSLFGPVSHRPTYFSPVVILNLAHAQRPRCAVLDRIYSCVLESFPELDPWNVTQIGRERSESGHSQIKYILTDTRT